MRVNRISFAPRLSLALAGTAATLILLNIHQSVSGGTSLQVGYAAVTPDAGTSVPIGAALLSVRNAAGVLVSQAGLAGVEPTRIGRLLVDQVGSRTGVALVNVNSVDATAALTLRDLNGQQTARQTLILRARTHIARYVTEIFPLNLEGFQGSLTFESDQPIGAIGLLESVNGYGEAIYVTCPVANLTFDTTANTAVFPQLAVGGGYSTRLILTNPTDTTMRGQIRFTAQDGSPLALNIGGSNSTSVSYEIPPQGAFRADLNNAAQLLVGWGEVQPDPNYSPPVATAIFQYRVNGQIVTGGSIPATGSTTLARLFVDNLGTRTGVAVANTSTAAQVLTIRLLDVNGNLQSTRTLTLGGRSQMAFFADELFARLGYDFNGVMEINGPEPFVALTLQLTINSRNDPILTTLPVADLARPAPTSLVFPQVVVGDQLSTRLIFVNADQTKVVTGTASFYQPDGSDMPVAYNGTVGSRFAYSVPAGASLQLASPSSTAAKETVVYMNDFNGPLGTTYAEWSVAAYSWTGNQAGTVGPGSGSETVTNIDSYNVSQRFFGELGGPVILKGPPYDAQHFVRIDESVSLYLANLPVHSSLTLAFDLYVLKSMDGNNPIYGPDRWQVSILGGPTLLSTTFSNNFKTGNDLSLQDYPSSNSPPETGSFVRNSLGYGFWFGDSSYHMSFTIPHTGNSVTIVFSSSENEGKSEPVHSTRDESWGLDNVRVTTK